LVEEAVFFRNSTDFAQSACWSIEYTTNGFSLKNVPAMEL